MEEKIGSLWSNTSKAGTEYLSGVIGGKKVIIFRNTRKKESKHPDWLVYPARDRTAPPARDENEPPF